MSRLNPFHPWFFLSPGGGVTAGSVDSDALADSAVSTGALQDCSVTSIKIADSTIVAADIADCTITSIKIADSTIVAGDIADSAITSVKIADSSIVSADIQDCGIATVDIADSAITSAKINLTAVTYGKIQDVAPVRLLGREDAIAGSPQEIALSAELRFDTTNDWVEISDSGILTGLIADSAITSIKIADATIVAGDLADSAVTTVKISDSNITTAKILDSAVTSIKIADATILAGDLADSAVTTIKISDSNITTAKILDSAVTSIKIADGTIAASDFSDTTTYRRQVQLVITDTTLATGDSQFHFFIPSDMAAFDLVDADAAVPTASTTGNPTIQIRNATDAADMLSTKITIDTAEKTSFTAVTAPVIDTANDSVASGDEIVVDIDSAGSAQGLNVILTFQKF